MRRKRNHGALLCLSGVLVGCIVTSAVCGRRVDELTIERDIYQSRFQNWQTRAIEAEENVSQLQAEEQLSLTYVGAFSCTAYCAEEYPHICGEGHGITSSGAKAVPGVTAAADISILPYGTVVYIENVGLRVIQDTGSAVKGNKLDVCVNTHEEALSWSGYGSRRVWVVSGGENQ